MDDEPNEEEIQKSGDLTVHDLYIVPAKATSEEERQRALRELVASWDAHPLRDDAPSLTRDELHERR